MLTRVINVFVAKMTIAMVTIVNQLLSISSYADMKHDFIALNENNDLWGYFIAFQLHWMALNWILGAAEIKAQKSKPCLTIIASLLLLSVCKSAEALKRKYNT